MIQFFIVKNSTGERFSHTLGYVRKKNERHIKLLGNKRFNGS